MSWGTGPVLSSVLACLSPLGARARSQVNKMWQETMNQGDEGIKEVRPTSGSKSLSFSFWACSSLSLPGRVQRLPLFGVCSISYPIDGEFDPGHIFRQ